MASTQKKRKWTCASCASQCHRIIQPKKCPACGAPFKEFTELKEAR
jgi:rubrerythrin